MASAVKFLPNRVWRVYLGGSGIDLLRGDEPVDGHFPEDWIASTSVANNPQYEKEDQGLSAVELPEGAVLFSEYLARDPENTLGLRHYEKFGANAALLMKILDAAETLPIQCHPTVEDAKKFFNSDFGKTEAWYVIATREVDGKKPVLAVGFNDKSDEVLFKAEARSGKLEESKKMLHELEVKPGNALLIRGGLVHAIGSGVTLIEVMEPSDLVIQPELYCGTQRLSENERWSGSDPETALKCFDYTPMSEAEVLQAAALPPEKIDECLQVLIPGKVAGFFEVQKLSCNGSYTLHNIQDCHRAGVVTRGSFSLYSGGELLELRCGDAFFLPFALKECVFEGEGDVIFALPPLACSAK